MVIQVTRRSEPFISNTPHGYSIRWREYFSDGTHKERRKTVQGTKAEAKKFARDLMDELDDQVEVPETPKVDPNGPTQTPVGQIVAAYIAHLKATKTHAHVEGDTIILREAFGECCEDLKYSQHYLKMVETMRRRARGRKVVQTPTIPVTHLEEITGSMISRWITEQLSLKRLAPRTINRKREVLRHLFNWARRHYNVRLPGPNPVTGDETRGIMGVEKLREPEPQVRYLKLSQVQQQLEVFADDPKWQAIVATYIYAGLRREELIWLTHDDVETDDRGNRWLHVRAKEVLGKKWKPKTGRDRTIPVAPALAKLLDQYTPALPTPWLFPTSNGKQWRLRNLNRHLQNHNKRAGLDWSFMDFRHTFGSLCVQNGVELYQVSEWMGNSPDVCRKHYARLDPRHEMASQKLSFFGSAPSLKPGELRVG